MKTQIYATPAVKGLYHWWFNLGAVSQAADQYVTQLFVTVCDQVIAVCLIYKRLYIVNLVLKGRYVSLNTEGFVGMYNRVKQRQKILQPNVFAFNISNDL